MPRVPLTTRLSASQDRDQLVLGDRVCSGAPICDPKPPLVGWPASLRTSPASGSCGETPRTPRRRLGAPPRSRARRRSGRCRGTRSARRARRPLRAGRGPQALWRPPSVCPRPSVATAQARGCRTPHERLRRQEVVTAPPVTTDIAASGRMRPPESCASDAGPSAAEPARKPGSAPLVPAAHVVRIRWARSGLGRGPQGPGTQLLGQAHLRDRPRVIRTPARDKAVGRPLLMFGLQATCQLLRLGAIHANQDTCPSLSRTARAERLPKAPADRLAEGTERSCIRATDQKARVPVATVADDVPPIGSCPSERRPHRRRR